MDLIKDKVNIITKLQIAQSLGATEIGSTINGIFNNDFKSLNSKNKDASEFLIDLVIMVLGSGYLQKITTDFLIKFLPNTESLIKDIILKQLIGKLGDKPLPSFFTSNGVNVKVGSIDYFDKFKINPNSLNGKHSYIANDFNSLLFNNVLQSVDNKFVTISALDVKFNLSDSVLTFKPNSNFSNHTVPEFFKELLTSNEFKLIDTKKIVADVVETIFNTLTKFLTTKALENDEKLKLILENIFNESNIETIFTLDTKAILDIENNVKKRKNGYHLVDLNCGVTAIDLNNDDIDEIVNSSDFVSSFNTVVKNKLSPDGIDDDMVFQNLFKLIIKAIREVLIKNTILDPKIVLLTKISDFLKTGNLNDDKNFMEDLKGQQNSFKNIVDKINEQFIDFLSNVVLKEVIKIVKPILIAVLKEKLNNYKIVNRSLLK